MYLTGVAKKRGGRDATDAALPGAAITRAPDLIRSQVADYLRKAIVSRQLRPGQLLVERELCDATTASRGSVREALRQLESEGLVVSDSGRGTWVASLSETQAQHLYQVRASLEGLAGGLFAINATDQQIAELEAIVAEIAGLADEPARMLAAKSKFYEMLFEGSGNPELQAILSMLRRRVTLARSTSQAVEGRPAKSVEEMRAILAAAKARDPLRTSTCCIDHIRAAAKAALGVAPHLPTHPAPDNSAVWADESVFPRPTKAPATG